MDQGDPTACILGLDGMYATHAGVVFSSQPPPDAARKDTAAGRRVGGGKPLAKRAKHGKKAILSKGEKQARLSGGGEHSHLRCENRA